MKVYPGTVTLSSERIAAVSRRRRKIVNCDERIGLDETLLVIAAAHGEDVYRANHGGTHYATFDTQRSDLGLRRCTG